MQELEFTLGVILKLHELSRIEKGQESRNLQPVGFDGFRFVSATQSAAGGAALSPDDEASAELNALREERALLTDKLNNHPDVRKYAGVSLCS